MVSDLTVAFGRFNESGSSVATLKCNDPLAW